MVVPAGSKVLRHLPIAVVMLRTAGASTLTAIRFTDESGLGPTQTDEERSWKKREERGKGSLNKDVKYSTRSV